MIVRAIAALLSLAFVLLFFALPVSFFMYPEPVKNTMTACSWCGQSYNPEKGYSVDNVQCVDEFTCELCVQRYAKAHNMTNAEFYCWKADEGPPILTKTATVLWWAMIIVVLVVLALVIFKF